MGITYERELSPGIRRARGSFYTPPDIASGLVEKALSRVGPATPPVVCDPAVGGGAFLLAAGRALERRGLDRRTIATDHLWGIDRDPDAVAVTIDALVAWVEGAGAGGNDEPDRGSDTARAAIAEHVRVGDALGPEDPLPGDRPPFDLVVGNPPFLNQLERATARTVEGRAQVRERFGPLAGAYTDAAGLFALVALDLAPAGHVALILPESFLVARDAGPVRAELLRRASLVGLWTADARVFGAAVDVCAPLLRVGGRASPVPVERWTGPAFAPRAPVEAPAPGSGSWSGLRPDTSQLPSGGSPGSGRLGDLTTATAGFRDQYYGVEACVVEADGTDAADGARDAAGPPGSAAMLLVTSGLIDPLVCHWGQRRARFARGRWSRPTVDLACLAASRPAVRAWAEARRRPKIVVATQTRVLEAAVDVDGRWYPSTPVVSVEPGTDELWLVAAVLLAPPSTVWAHRRYGGGALSRDALKLSARQLLELPLPPDRRSWTEAADVLARSADGAADRRAILFDAARLMCQAYDAGEDTFVWWRDRLPAGVFDAGGPT